MNQFVEHLHALRMFSINIVECVHAWQEYVLFAWRQMNHKSNDKEPHIQFIYQGNNYLLKMRKDNSFLGLKSNPFLKHFNFTDRGDPFLILPSCEYTAVGALKKRKNKKAAKNERITIPVEQSILKKIKRCE